MFVPRVSIELPETTTFGDAFTTVLTWMFLTKIYFGFTSFAFRSFLALTSVKWNTHFKKIDDTTDPH